MVQTFIPQLLIGGWDLRSMCLLRARSQHVKSLASHRPLLVDDEWQRRRATQAAHFPAKLVFLVVLDYSIQIVV